MNDHAWAALRLRRAAEFEAVLSEARRVSSRNFNAWARPNGGTSARLGIIAGRKAAARAVDRNRGKRIIRELFRALLADLGSVDVVVQLRTTLRDTDNATLRTELSRLLRRASVPGADQLHGR